MSGSRQSFLLGLMIVSATVCLVLGLTLPIMRLTPLRKVAADLRADALEGLDARAQRQLIDHLLQLKANLLRMNEGGGGLEHSHEGADVGAAGTITV
jgi:hypothetical protein